MVGEGLLKSPAQHKTVRRIVCAHASVRLKTAPPWKLRCTQRWAVARLVRGQCTIPFARPHVQKRNLFSSWLIARTHSPLTGTQNMDQFFVTFIHASHPVCLLTVLSHDAHDRLTVWNKSKRVLTVYYAIMTNSICVLLKETISSFV